MNTFLFIFVCVLSIVTVIIFSFVSSAIHKRDLCRKSPYYHCDLSWTCCKTKSCDTTGPNSDNSYKAGEQFYGTNATGNTSGALPIICADGTANDKSYFQACIYPVQVITKELNKINQAPDFSFLYDTSKDIPSGYQNYFPTNYTLVKGQCCYQNFDASAKNNSAPAANNYYPSLKGGNLDHGSWNSTMQTNFGNNYPGSGDSGPTYSFKSADTTNNSCSNSFFGAPANTATGYTAYRYSNCPGATS